MNRVWTEAELEVLRRDRAEKVPIPVIAAKLGRPVPATYARARLIGTLVQPHRSWDEVSIVRLCELVSTEPPMTDKCIVQELGRTVAQIRWKMQDLGLIGVRDLSVLAKITASKGACARGGPPSPRKPTSGQTPVAQRTDAPLSADTLIPDPLAECVKSPIPAPASASADAATAVKAALECLETTLAQRLRKLISEAEADMVIAATDAIAEKRRIDQRLANLGEQIAQLPAERINAEKRSAEDSAQHRANSDKGPRTARMNDSPPEGRKRVAAGSPAKKAPRLTIAAGASPACSRHPTPPAARPTASKIVVLEAPVTAASSLCKDAAPALTSGRGGWKSVRQDPARALAQARAKAKPATRADAMDLAHAAQAAIKLFIAERGVTKAAETGIQALVVRLQARGYIVVPDSNGWIIDRHTRLATESALVAFAEARGISSNTAPRGQGNVAVGQNACPNAAL